MAVVALIEAAGLTLAGLVIVTVTHIEKKQEREDVPPWLG